MLKQSSIEDRKSQVVIAELDFPTICSQGSTTAYDIVQMDNVEESDTPEESPEERIEIELQRKYSIEERVFLIVNKVPVRVTQQTGEVFDSRNEAVVDNLLKRNTIPGSSTHQWNSYWKQLSALHEQYIEAATQGDLPKLKHLIQTSSSQMPLDINHKSFDNWTALHYAAMHGHNDCVELILKNKAVVDHKSKFGWTALHVAAKQNQVACGATLLKFGADPNSQDGDFYTPLHYAAECGFADMAQLLIKSGADQKLRNCQGRTARECSLNITIFNLLDGHEKLSYSKEVFGGVLLPNSRTDHIERLLNNKRAFKEEEKKVEKKEEKPTNKFLNIIKIYQTLSSKKNESISLKDFTFYKLLGRGSFGEVYLVKKTGDETPYALKVLRKEKVIGTALARYIQTEKEVLSLISHPFIVRLYYAFQTETRLFLVMKYCPGGDLSKIIEQKKKFTEEVARIYICQIILALEALHKSMIIYRDLKPENLVLDEHGHVMLTDFGLSKKGQIDKLNSSFCGTPAYLAPQILQKKGHNRMADWYEMGVVLYQFLTGTPPFYASTREELYKNKRQNLLKIPKNWSEDCKDLVMQLLAKDPNKRIGIEKDGESIREHPWFKDINWEGVYNRELKPPVYSTRPVNYNNPINIRFPEGNNEKKDMPDWSFFS